MRRVVVTGSSGLVGSAVVEALRDETATVGVDLVAGPRTNVVGDIRSGTVRRSVIEGAWALVHVAALHAPHVGSVPDADFWAINVEATRALLDEGVRAGVERFVYTSSTSVYGNALVPNGPRAVWVDEHLTPDPRDIYDTTKLAAEQLVSDSRLSSVVLRIARCFPEPPPTMAAHRLHRGVAVEDVAVAHRLALEHHTVTGTFNIAGPLLFQPADADRLWSEPAALVDERCPEVIALFSRRDWPLPRRIDRVYDSGAARSAFGYAPNRGAMDVGLSL